MLWTNPLQPWSTVTYFLLNTYFSQSTTICVLHHKDFDLQWPNDVNYYVYLRIHPPQLSESFAKDVYNYTQQDRRFIDNGVYYDDWIKKFVAALQQTFCEGFVVFQDDIPKFAAAFRVASLYSKWRSRQNQFLFIYTKDQASDDYFGDDFFRKFPAILLLESASQNATYFSLKCIDFLASSSTGHAIEFMELLAFNPLVDTFTNGLNISYSPALGMLHGHKIIAGLFDYRPFNAVDYERYPRYYDHDKDNPRHEAHVDGSEMHIVHTFCEIYNCTVEVDTSEKSDWGMVFPNFTADGLMGMALDGRIHMAMGAIYAWDISYDVLDHTLFLGRSGVTCLVPAPTGITSWDLPLRPFNVAMWLCIVFGLFMEAVIFLLSRHLEMLEMSGNDYDDVHLNWCQSMQFGISYTYKLILSQAMPITSQSKTLKVMLFISLMTDLIITSIYGGGLAAILTLPTLEEVADSVERLYKFNLTWTASSFDWIFSIIPNEDDNEPLFQRLVDNYRIHTMEEISALAETENMGFVVERMTFGHFGNGEFISPKSLNRLKLMVDDIYYQYTVGIVPRLWAPLPKLNDFILLWHSAGFDKYWEQKIVAEYMSPHAQDKVRSSMNSHVDLGPKTLDIDNFAGLILVWLVGIGMSILAFVGELMASKRQIIRNE